MNYPISGIGIGPPSEQIPMTPDERTKANARFMVVAVYDGGLPDLEGRGDEELPDHPTG